MHRERQPPRGFIMAWLQGMAPCAHALPGLYCQPIARSLSTVPASLTYIHLPSQPPSPSSHRRFDAASTTSPSSPKAHPSSTWPQLAAHLQLATSLPQDAAHEWLGQAQHTMVPRRTPTMAMKTPPRCAPISSPTSSHARSSLQSSRPTSQRPASIYLSPTPSTGHDCTNPSHSRPCIYCND